MKTHANKGSAEAKDPATSVSEMTEAFRKNCEQALRTGLKFQEEAGRWWGSVSNPAVCAQYWQQQVNTVTRAANNVLPLVQKPVGELIELVEKNSRTSADLMKQALEAAQKPGVAESQAKWIEFWTSSLGAAKVNAETLSEIQSKAMGAWVDFMRNNGEMCESQAA